jgi:hypothetical protein
VRRSGRNRPRVRHLLAESLPDDHLDDDYHDHHFLLSASDGLLLRRHDLRRRLSRLRQPRSPRGVPAGHDLHDERDDVRLHRPRDPLRRPQAERSDVQLLPMGHLPAGDDVRRRPERERMRFRLRLPLKPS